MGDVRTRATSHEKGTLTFEGDATFARNAVKTDELEEIGRGGAISNIGSASITFKGKLTMEDNVAEVRLR